MLLDASELSPTSWWPASSEQTGGRGADIVLDCSGVPETFVASLRMARVGGTVVEAGAFVDMGPVAVNPNADICSRNVAVLGIGGETAESYLPAMELLARNLDRLPLEKLRLASAASGRRPPRHRIGPARRGDEGRALAHRGLSSLND